MNPRVLGIILFVGMLVGLLIYSQSKTEPLKVSGFIESDEIRVGSRVGGRVGVVHVKEGDEVSKGVPLVELEPFDLKEQAAQAEAVLQERRAARDRLLHGYRPEEVAQAEQRKKQLEANYQKLKNGPRAQEIKAAEANVEQAQAQLLLAEQEEKRIARLIERKAVTQDDMDKAVNSQKVAQSTLKVRSEELDLLKAGTRAEELQEAEFKLLEAEFAWKMLKAGYREEELKEAEAAVQAAEAALKVISRQIEELVIRAPVDGTVEAVDLQPGDLVGANSAAISLIDRNELWVRAYVPENRLNVRVGQDVAVTVDSYPGRAFPAKIAFVARQAEFTPGNVQTPEERSKQVFRIKATLTDGLQELRPGMAADVWLEKPAAKDAKVAARLQ